jgi:phage shock protein PspC (stress-responsive transcriptional regulator)
MEDLFDIAVRLVSFLMGVFIVGVLLAAVFNVALYSVLVACAKALV